MEIAGYIAALLIGISLGMIGGGGSILTVPVLVYLMNVSPLLATTFSLFIVGTSSLAGGIRAYTQKQIDFKAFSEFGFPSIFSVFIARHYLLPLIPSHIFNAGGFEITRDRLLMLVFSLLMFFTSFLIIADKTKDQNEKLDEDEKHSKAIELAFAGLFVGLITGLLGAGGGFLIVPILVLYIRLPIKTAVGTSLMIVAINSLFGFLFSLKQFSFDWKILIIFSLISIVGIFIGSRFAQKFSGTVLKKIFGWFILVVATGILLRELIFTAL